MKNVVLLRILYALPLVAVIIACLEATNPLYLWILIFAVSGVALWEYFKNETSFRDNVERVFGITWGLVLAALLYWLEGGPIITIFGLFVGPVLFFLFRPGGDLKTIPARLGSMVFGLVYAGLLLTFAAMLKRDAGGRINQWLYLLCMIAIFSDTGAYAFGRLLGRFFPRKLYPMLSPKKTWIGMVGGLGGAFFGAVIMITGFCAPFFPSWHFPELRWSHGALLTLVGACLGVCGDLIESMLKRGWGVKDTSSILGPHGGILDRIDSWLLIIPWVYIFVRFIGP